MIPNPPIPGHALRYEGAPHDDKGQRIVRSWYVTTSGNGRALCECGAMSDVLPSPNKRKAWHREHKAALRTEATP